MSSMLRHLPLSSALQNRIRPESTQIAPDLLTWMAMLALAGSVRRWEPGHLRLRIFFAAHLVTTGCRRYLHSACHRSGTPVITSALAWRQVLPRPGCPAETLIPAGTPSPPGAV